MQVNLDLATNNVEEIRNEKLVIIGGGPAGLSAALYAARADLSPLVLIGLQLGGQAALTNDIENYPGFVDGINGAEVGDLFLKQAEKFGAKVEYDLAESIDFSEQPYTINTVNGQKIKAMSIIIASGASPRHLEIPGEAELTGKGVSYCGTCDAFFFRDKEVVVVGGGDSALEEGLFLTRFANKVTIVHRRDELRAGAILEKRARENEKIEFIWDTVVEEINGDEKVKSVTLKNRKTGETQEFETDGIFIFIGHIPNSDFLGDALVKDDLGYVVSDRQMRTNIEGVFTAGEISDPDFRQVVTSAGMGAAAAIQATRYLEMKEA